MKNIRATILTTCTGIITFAGLVHPVYAQSLFVDQPISTPAPIATPDPELQKVLPLAFADATPPVTTSSADDGMFTTIFVDNTPESVAKQVTGTEKIMPIASDDMIGISTFFSRFHPGIDIRAKIGTTIRAILPGVVSEVGYEPGGYGRFAILIHHMSGKTFFSLYAHMKEASVAQGDMVTSGDRIGEVGMSGHTTGPHLHFEIHDNQDAIDPISFFANNTLAMAKK